MERKKIKISSNKNFGVVFFVFFLILSLWPLMYGGNIKLSFMVISITFLTLGLINSKILTPLNHLWFKFGLFLGKIISPLVMGLIFFLVVTPTGIIMRLLKKDLLNLKKDNSNSYWIEKKNENNNMKNQF